MIKSSLLFDLVRAGRRTEERFAFPVIVISLVIVVNLGSSSDVNMPLFSILMELGVVATEARLSVSSTGLSFTNKRVLHVVRLDSFIDLSFGLPWSSSNLYPPSTMLDMSISSSSGVFVSSSRYALVPEMRSGK